MLKPLNKIIEWILSSVVSFVVFSLFGLFSQEPLNHKTVQLLNIQQEVLYALIFGLIITIAWNIILHKKFLK